MNSFHSSRLYCGGLAAKANRFGRANAPSAKAEFRKKALLEESSGFIEISCD
jgi:hypothetical protein